MWEVDFGVDSMLGFTTIRCSPFNQNFCLKHWDSLLRILQDKSEYDCSKIIHLWTSWEARHLQRYLQSDQKILLPLLLEVQVHLHNELPACLFFLLLLQYERWEACIVRLQHGRMSRCVIQEHVVASCLRQRHLPCAVWHQSVKITKIKYVGCFQTRLNEDQL